MEPLRTLTFLLSLLRHHPLELRDRVAGYADRGLDLVLREPPAYASVSYGEALRDLQARLGRATEILKEPELAETEEHTRRLLADTRRTDPFRPRWAADSLLAHYCYLTSRLLRPDVVVETGVAYGVSSAFILTALEKNGRGTLHSVDLPPPRREYEKSWGVAVPEALGDRWTLHRGTSGRVLPRLLEEVGPVGLFVHDSQHTHRNMRREFEAVWPHLRAGGVLLADDVERNRAFGELRRKNPALWRVVRDREVRPFHGKAAPTVFGVAMK